MKRAPLEPLDPEAPGLDEDTRRRRRALAAMGKMTPTELRELATRAGIMTGDGKLTPPYTDSSPSAYRKALTDGALDIPILEVLESRKGREPIALDDVIAALRENWAIRETEVRVRLRRMKDRGLVAEQNNCWRFSATAAGREQVKAAGLKR